MTEIIRACEQLALVGIRERYPQASEREIRLRLAALRLDRETMVRIFGWDFTREGEFYIEEEAYAIPDNVGFKVNLPNRESFSPDATFYIGKPTGMKFLEGAPTFAAEVRSEGDYGPAAEEKMAEKRADYFGRRDPGGKENFKNSTLTSASALKQPCSPACFGCPSPWSGTDRLAR